MMRARAQLIMLVLLRGALFSRRMRKHVDESVPRHKEMPLGHPNRSARSATQRDENHHEPARAPQRLGPGTTTSVR